MSNPAITVVVADDNPEMLQVVTSVLSQHFTVVRSVSSGDSLITAVLELQPDVVVSDLDMQPTDGIDAMLQLRAVGIKAPFVLMGVEDGEPQFTMEEGAAAYVHKYDIFADLVNAVLEVRASRTFVSHSANSSGRSASEN